MIGKYYVVQSVASAQPKHQEYGSINEMSTEFCSSIQRPVREDRFVEKRNKEARRSTSVQMGDASLRRFARNFESSATIEGLKFFNRIFKELFD